MASTRRRSGTVVVGNSGIQLRPGLARALGDAGEVAQQVRPAQLALRGINVRVSRIWVEATVVSEEIGHVYSRRNREFIREASWCVISSSARVCR